MRKVYYSLTGRGLYSEILNLLLAIVYCERNNFELIVNTRNWNAREKDGWSDYFANTIKSTNQFASSQVFFNGRYHHISIRGLYKMPQMELAHIMHIMANYVFKQTTRNMLSDDIVNTMRSAEFISSVGDIHSWHARMQNVLRSIYVHNEKMNEEISEFKREIGLMGQTYIGVHIRRGDKIQSKEMELIPLRKYADAIVAKNRVSKRVYIATDDHSVVDEMKKILGPEYTVLNNRLLGTGGFDESRFNRKNKTQRIHEVKLAFYDVDVLRNSDYFIGTYSSNLSRIIPCFKGLENCESLDIDWTPVF